jgi:alkaline phosphatase D
MNPSAIAPATVAAAFWFVVLCAASAQQSAPADTLVGPMVGAVTETEAWLWAYAGKGAKLQVRYRRAAQSGGKWTTLEMPAPAEHHYAGKVLLTGLEPNTAYRYEVLCNGQTNPNWSGTFTTAPPRGKPVRFTMAFSSCMRPDRYPKQPAWDNMLALKPSFHLLLGDNVYADTTDREKLWAAHLQQRRVPEFANLIRQTPTYAMWDDHDYGPNNSDGTAKGKQDSLRAFTELFCNPAAGTKETAGAFYRFSWGDVDFFVLDGRYHRSPNNAPNDETKRMLGDAQFAWLVDGLKSSRAKFKVLASGSTMIRATDSWALFDFERKRLFKAIMDNKIGGVIYLSGDLHRCLVVAHPPQVTGGYPIYEFISSGIANSPPQGFMTLQFDTTAEDPTLSFRIHNLDGKPTLFDGKIKWSDLQVK